ncbi:DUF4232 domain-containing protein [Streptomyces harbinensis]|uniref:DUF4232 domain-containing protein n=1 Tax=Streptomyces harbinensis TaxID=1176198 RepID=UPI0036B7E0F6
MASRPDSARNPPRQRRLPCVPAAPPRTARLALAITAAAALTATLTACEDEVVDNGADTSDSAGAGDSGSDDTAPEGSGDGEGNPVEQVCGTTDLTFTVSEESQAGGYLLVTAQANEGITCYLYGTYPVAAFGSAEDSHAFQIEQGASEDIQLSGDTVAYAGIQPKTTGDEHGAEYEQLIIGILDDPSDPVGLPLDAPVLVDEPGTTKWTADPALAVPTTY